MTHNAVLSGAATELAKYMNLKDKNLRIELFQLVLGDKEECQTNPIHGATAFPAAMAKSLWPGIKSFYGTNIKSTGA